MIYRSDQRDWHDTEIMLIADNPDLDILIMADLIGCSISDVVDKASEMRLRLNYAYKNNRSVMAGFGYLV